MDGPQIARMPRRVVGKADSSLARISREGLWLDRVRVQCPGSRQPLSLTLGAIPTAVRAAAAGPGSELRAGVRGATTGAAIASNGLMPSVWRLSTRPRRVSASGAATAPARDAIARWVHAFNERELEGMLAGQFEIAPFCAPHRSVDGLIVTAHHYLPTPRVRLGPCRAHLPRERLAQRAPRLASRRSSRAAKREP